MESALLLFFGKVWHAFWNKTFPVVNYISMQNVTNLVVLISITKGWEKTREKDHVRPRRKKIFISFLIKIH